MLASSIRQRVGKQEVSSMCIQSRVWFCLLCQERRARRCLILASVDLRVWTSVACVGLHVNVGADQAGCQVVAGLHEVLH